MHLTITENEEFEIDSVGSSTTIQIIEKCYCCLLREWEMCLYLKVT